MPRLRFRPSEPTKPSHERWLVSYADFVTLLLAFFVSLYAFTRLDSQKLAEAQLSIRTALHFIFPGGQTPVIPELRGDSLTKGVLPQDGRLLETDAEKVARLEQELDHPYQELRELLTSTSHTQEAQLFFTPDGLVIRFQDLILFDTAKADIKPEILPLLGNLAAILNKIPNDIVVEGHTDSRPIHTSQFPSNWELSTARATAIARYLIETAGVSPERLAVAGYGEYRPVADNRTESGQGANRRVDIIVRPDKQASWRGSGKPRA